MGILDRILGIEPQPQQQPQQRGSGVQQAVRPPQPQQGEDAQAIERYRYMLKTAPPETLEQAHAEAFAKLTPEQRQQVLATLANAAPPEERQHAAATSPDDPRAMGRLATRTELRQPGFMERTFGGGGGGGMGMGMGMGPSLLSSFAMGFVGSMVAQSFFSSMGGGMGMHDASNAMDDQANDPAETETDGADGDADTDTADAFMDDGGGDMDLGGGDMDLGGGDFDV